VSRLRERTTLVARGLSACSQRGTISLGTLRFPCAFGRSGRLAVKREGDGASPMGRWRMRQVYYRPDRVRRPLTGLPVRTIRRQDGWCDAPAAPCYNRFVRLPYPASAEHLWRDDRLYDLVVVLDYNERPRARYRGSAIFVHIARPLYAPTEGCIAVGQAHLRRLLSLAGRGTAVLI